MKVVLLSGGGGGARLARGLYAALDPGELTVIGNVGDDVEILGLHVSPDLDSIVYTVAGLIDESRGWGRSGETWNALAAASAWGGEDWFKLGDLDIGLHLVRTQALAAGATLSEATAQIVEHASLDMTLVPASDERLRTQVVTSAGTFPFQDWYVGRAHEDEVDAVEYEGALEASPAPGVLDALGEAEAVILAPSNPYLSIGPILAVSAIRDALEARTVRSVAVSPLVGGKAVSGPLDRMLSHMAGGTTPAHVAERYEGLIDALVVDGADSSAGAPVDLVEAETLMHDRDAERQLAEIVLKVACA